LNIETGQIGKTRGPYDTSCDPENLGTILVERARAMKPMLRESADQADRDRQVSLETVAMFREAGFFKILQPREFGGFELPMRVMVDVIFEVASACGAAGWVLAILGIHMWDVRSLSDEARTEIWGENTDALLSSAYAPTGEVKAVEGGHVLNGRWPFSSGCDHAQWVILGGLIPSVDEGAPPVLQGFFLPRSDYEILDDWHVMGMRGTGSKSIVVRDSFVPARRQHPTMQSSLPNPPDVPPLYRLPFLVVFREPLAAVAYGMAQNALDCFVERTRVRKGAFDGSKMSENPVYHRAFAETEYAIRAARALQHANLDATMAELMRGGPPDPLRLGRFLSEATYSAQQCYIAVSQLFAISGGNGLRDGDPLQLAFRDMAAAATHPSFNFNAYGPRYGAQVLNAPTS
jgi:3-hydroxy-9,10-secoandrosta-1,3,5(10)-triene-9,17-dione monooxygenase